MISLLIGGKLLGIVGALLALPIAAALRMMVTTLRVELPGDQPIGLSDRREDAEAERELERRTAGLPTEDAAAIAMDIAEEQRILHATEPAETKSA
jgi:hypothetical protein